MTLKVESKEERIEKLRKEIEHHLKYIKEIEEVVKEVRREILELQIAPFKLGGYAMCKVSSGRTQKLQKCLLECNDEYGHLQVRPVKEDGTLSSRHFIKFPDTNGDYLYALQEVEE